MSLPSTSKPTPEAQTSPHILSDMLEQPPQIPPSSSAIIPLTHKKPTLYQAAVSELLGTMILVLFGDGAIAQVTLSGGSKGDYQSISWAWGYLFFPFLSPLPFLMNIYIYHISKVKEEPTNYSKTRNPPRNLHLHPLRLTPQPSHNIHKLSPAPIHAPMVHPAGLHPRANTGSHHRRRSHLRQLPLRN